MGLFSKLKKMAVDNAMDALKDKAGGIPPVAGSGILDKIADNITKEKSAVQTPPPTPPAMKAEAYDDEDYDDENYDDENYDDEDYDDEDYDENYDEDEDDYDDDEDDYDDVSDEDLYEFGESVDEVLATGNPSQAQIDGLQMRAAALGIEIDEFEQLLRERMEQLQAAIDAGYDRDEVYRTRSVWRRCPNCGHLVSAKEMYCPWCGYQLRHRAATMIMGGLLYAGAVLSEKGHRGRPVGKKPRRKGTAKKATAKRPVHRSASPGQKPEARKRRITARSDEKRPLSSRPSSAQRLRARSDEKKTSVKKESIFASSSKPVSRPKKSGGLLSGGKKKKSGALLGGIKKRKR